MTDKEKNAKLVQENLTILLEEFTREQQANSLELRKLRQSVEAVTQNQQKLLQRFSENKSQNASLNPMKMQEMIRRTMSQCYQSTKSSQKVVRQLQILLFPEKDAKLFYKIVFGRWFLMLVILFAFSCIYRFSLHQSDNNLKIEFKKVENDRFKRAWNALYQQQNTKGKKQMDRAYNKSI